MDWLAVHRDGTPRFGGKSLIAAVVIGLLASALLVIGTSELPHQQRNASDWVAHTLEVLGAAATLDADLATVVSEERGFFIDKAADSKARFDAAARQVDGDVASLRALTADNAGQQSALDRLEVLIAAPVAVLREIMQQVEAGDAEGALRSARTQRGRALMDQVLKAIEGIQAEERRLLDRRSEAA